MILSSQIPRLFWEVNPCKLLKKRPGLLQALSISCHCFFWIQNLLSSLTCCLCCTAYIKLCFSISKGITMYYQSLDERNAWYHFNLQLSYNTVLHLRSFLNVIFPLSKCKGGIWAFRKWHENSWLSRKASGKWPLRIQKLEVTAFVTGLLLFLNEKG